MGPSVMHQVKSRNRAAKRQQKKLARKAAKNRRGHLPQPLGQGFGGAPTSHFSELVLKGTRLHQAGQLQEAETIYRRILDIDPDHADANHFLGVLLSQGGNQAVELISRAIAMAPDQPMYHGNLGTALKELGRLDEAIASYREALAIEPDFADAHNNLGHALKTKGRLEDAVASYHKALAVKPDFAEAHNNLGVALRVMGKSDEAVASYRKALAIKPYYAAAHYNLGNLLTELGRLEEAVASYRKTLAIKPDFAEAHNNLGNLLHVLEKSDEAVASHHKALVIKPDYAAAHYNLGNVLRDLGRLEEAVASYCRALAIKPEFAEAHNGLGGALQELGKLEHAFKCRRRAVALDPGNDTIWADFSSSIEAISFASVDDDLWQDLLRLLERPTVRPSNVVRPIISALRHHSDFSRILELTGSGNPESGIAYGDVAGQLSAIPLFLRIMGLSPIHVPKIELMLTVLRRAMLEDAATGMADERSLPFSAALALQCFSNEYVYSESDAETAAVGQLEQEIATLVDKEREVPPSFVAALGAYRPLDGFSWAQNLCEREWAGNIKDVIERQILEPREERSLRSGILRLTSMQNTVSRSVREQYEENPYPRWIKTDIGHNGKAIGAVLRGAPLRLDLGDYVSPENPEILVAGCGTGQHALLTASRFSEARVLAVDLSLSSLSYALRKTDKLGVANIEYAQGDIMELGGLGRQFDLVECVGVLHHLSDPLAGWRVLLDLLKPGGLMNIGLYSETARRDIVDGRALIAEEGYTTSPEDIRRCRQDMIAMAEDGNREMAKLCSRTDFFNLSNCRDLLFHVQEHRFTLPRIEEALASLKLKFLGFEHGGHGVLRSFRKSHPSRRAPTSLSLWHKFELKNPNTFGSMYQFWCKKM